MLRHGFLRSILKAESLRSHQTWSISKRNENKLIPTELEQKIRSVENVETDVFVKDKPKYIIPKTVTSMCINKSEMLQELFKLNVNFHKLEQNKEGYEYILQQNFVDIKAHIEFLTEFKLEDADVGAIITKNPLLLKEDLEDLNVRINYLKYKKFTDEMITAILKKNPFWLTHSTEQIDNYLGVFQMLFKLKGSEVRELVMKNSKVITFSLDKIKENVFTLKEEMGFHEDELKELVLKTPKLLLLGQDKLLKTFEYLHHTMKISHRRIIDESAVLTYRKKRIQPRHLFLSKLGRAQYDPKLPNYVSLLSLVCGTDVDFCVDIAKSSVEAYNVFLKSL